MAFEKRKDFLVFGRPQVGQEEKDEVLGTLERAWMGTGPLVHRFEAEFAAYKGRGPEQVAALNSCTAALHLACLAAGLGPGHEVIAPAMTFCATVNAIIHSGATPVIADVDPDTLCITAEEIEKHLTDKTRAVMVVHYAGRPCDMDPILALAKQRNLAVIEDCAHAIETEYKGRKAGTMGTLGCFSFYATKNVVTGEGGMVTAADEALIKRIKIMGLHGMTADAWARFSDAGYKHYFVVDHGFKYNMMDMQAAMGVHQLARVEANWQRRCEVWDTYMRELADTPLGLPAQPAPDTRHAYHLYPVRVDPARCGVGRDDFLAGMTARNIGVGVHYLSLTEHPYYMERFGWAADAAPVAREYGRQTVSLPLSPVLGDEDVADVVAAVRDVLGQGAKGSHG